MTPYCSLACALLRAALHGPLPMLTDKPSDQYELIAQAVDLRDEHLDEERIREYAGNDYRRSWHTAAKDMYETHPFEMIANTVPNLVYTNPEVQIDGILPGVDDAPAAMLDAAFKTWIPSVRMASKLTEIAYDTMFSFGASLLTLGPVPGYDHDEPAPLWPMLWRVSPRRFFQDSEGGRDHWRFRGHVWIADKADLLEARGPDGKPVFFADAVADLVEDEDVDKARGTDSEKKRHGVPRKEVAGYEVYYRETGMIYTLGLGQKGEGVWLRPPRPSVSRTDGPYTLFGLYLVPDQVYPLPPLAVTAAKVREINAHREQISKDAGVAKKIVLYDESQPAIGKKLAAAESGHFYGVPGLLSGALKELEFGGPPQENREHVMELRDELWRASGLTDVRRGNVQGDPTATEISEVEQADDVRTQFIRSQFRGSVVEMLEKVGHLMLTSEEVRFPVSVPNPMTGEPMVMWYQGGMDDGQSDPSFPERVRVKIEPYSMEYINETSRQRKTLQMTEAVMGISGVLIGQPWLKGQKLIDDLGESQNVKDAGARYIDWDIVRAAQQMAVIQQTRASQAEAAGAAGAEPGQPPEEPGDVTEQGAEVGAML